MAQVVMGVTDTKTVTVCPKEYREISDILPKNERISEEMELTLNKAEIKRAMSNAVVKEGDTVLNETNYFLKEEEEVVEDEETEEPDNSEGLDEGSQDPEQPVE